MKFVAHRGFSLKHKDNSVIAIREAVDRNYDGVEIDVQLCKSGELILYHDIYIDNSFVSDLTYKELKTKCVCSLPEVYNHVPELNNTLLIIDMKGNNIEICEALRLFFLERSTHSVYFCSFNRNLIHNLPSYFLKGATFETTFIENEYDFILRDLNAVVLHWTCLDEKLIEYCKKNNICVFTYTHKEDMELTYMLKYDVDGVITNGFQC